MLSLKRNGFLVTSYNTCFRNGISYCLFNVNPDDKGIDASSLITQYSNMDLPIIGNMSFYKITSSGGKHLIVLAQSERHILAHTCVHPNTEWAQVTIKRIEIPDIADYI